MNLYLAEYRALNYSNLLIAKIKELCGETITIKQLPPISYLGQPEKKGKQFRSVILTPNAPTIEIHDTKPIDGSEIEISDKEKIKTVYTDIVGSQPISITITIDGKSVTVGNNTDGSVNAIKTKNGFYLSKRFIEQFKIPETPDSVIDGVTYTVGGPISFNDENGNKQTFKMSEKPMGVNHNEIYFNISQGKGEIKPWFSSVDCGHGSSFSDAEGSLFTGIPFTTYKSDDEKQYKGEWFFKVVNSWFAYSGIECVGSDIYGKPKTPPRTDFRNMNSYKNITPNLESMF